MLLILSPTQVNPNIRCFELHRAVFSFNNQLHISKCTPFLHRWAMTAVLRHASTAQLVKPPPRTVIGPDNRTDKSEPTLSSDLSMSDLHFIFNNITTVLSELKRFQTSFLSKAGHILHANLGGNWGGGYLKKMHIAIKPGRLKHPASISTAGYCLEHRQLLSDTYSGALLCKHLQ